MKDFFVSYNRADRQWAKDRGIAALLHHCCGVDGTGPIALSPHPCYNTHTTSSPSEQRSPRGNKKDQPRCGRQALLFDSAQDKLRTGIMPPSCFAQEGQAR